MRRLINAQWGLLLLLAVAACSTSSEEPVVDEISDEILAQFTDLGFDISDIEVLDHFNPITGETKKMYQLEQDILISPEQMQEMLDSDIAHLGAMQEQYRTSNLVSNNQTISILGYTGGSYALDNTMQTALSWAVNNYNRLNIGLTFSLSYGTNYQSADMVVYRTSGGGGGSAGFPSGGAPYKWINILSGTSSYGTNVTEHVITHEMGHCVGLRHTDYFDRSYSCGSGGNEGSAGVGAIHIPGTPTGIDPNSIMLACFSSNEDGEFSSSDIDALEYLY